MVPAPGKHPRAAHRPRPAHGRRTKHGQTNDDFTLSVDLAPTILAAAGIPAPETMQGRDLAPALPRRDRNPQWRTEFFYEHPTLPERRLHPGLRGPRAQGLEVLLLARTRSRQLFDLQADPREENDLAGDPEQQERLAEMRKRFGELKEAAR